MTTYFKKIFVFFFLPLALFSNEIEPQTLINALGESLKIWLSQENEDILLRSAIFTPSQGWSESVVISNPERNVVSSPLFYMNKSGDAVVVWQSLDTSTSMICMENSIYLTNHPWSDPKILSDENENVEACSYELQLTDLGYFSVLWHSISPETPTQINTKAMTVNINENVQ